MVLTHKGLSYLTLSLNGFHFTLALVFWSYLPTSSWTVLVLLVVYSVYAAIYDILFVQLKLETGFRLRKEWCIYRCRFSIHPRERAHTITCEQGNRHAYKAI